MNSTLFENSKLPPSANTTTQMWFISVSHRHLGPYSTDQISSKLREGKLSKATAAWCDGMSDWLALSQIEAFRSVAAELPETSSFANWELPDDLALDFAESDPSAIFEELVPKIEHPQLAKAIEDDLCAATTETQNRSTFSQITASNDAVSSGVPILSDSSSAANVIERPPASQPNAFFEQAIAATPAKIDPNVLAWANFFDSQGLKAPRRALLELPFNWKFGALKIPQQRFLGAAIVVGTLLIGALTWFSVGALRDLPFREDMTRKDYREMQSAVGESLRRHGPAVAIAMSQSDLQTPIFYVGSNFPDGTRFNVRIDGIPEMLLERLKVSVEATVSAHGGVAKTPAFREEDGKSFPRGEYRVTIQCLSCEKTTEATPGAKPVVPTVGQKTFFLGGVRDQDYDQRLKTYHEKLQQEAADEVVEIKQVLATLDTQFRDTSDKFEKVLIARAPDIQGPTIWPTFHTNWMHLQDGLESLFKRWTPDALENGFVYGRNYTFLKDVGRKIQELHKEQTDYLVARKVNPATEARIQSDESEIKAELQVVHEKTSYIEQVPTTANGMPIRP